MSALGTGILPSLASFCARAERRLIFDLLRKSAQVIFIRLIMSFVPNQIIEPGAGILLKT